jgi:peptidyl-prolyl cis-trans isomerase D
VTPEVFEFGNKYVVAVVTGIREKGDAPLEQVRAEIELEVRKLKKAEIISREFKTAMESAGDIEGLGVETGLAVQQASNINFSSVTLPGAGIEPKVIAAASVLPPDQLSEPVTGNNGVYVLVVTNVSESEPTDLTNVRDRMSSLRESQANFEAYDALRVSANIKDNRAKFF